MRLNPCLVGNPTLSDAFDQINCNKDDYCEVEGSLQFRVCAFGWLGHHFLWDEFLLYESCLFQQRLLIHYCRLQAVLLSLMGSYLCTQSVGYFCLSRALTKPLPVFLSLLGFN